MENEVTEIFLAALLKGGRLEQKPQTSHRISAVCHHSPVQTCNNQKLHAHTTVTIRLLNVKNTAIAGCGLVMCQGTTPTAYPGYATITGLLSQSRPPL